LGQHRPQGVALLFGQKLIRIFIEVFMPYRQIKKNDGFTLSEIMVTITIVGILGALALPRLTGTVERMRVTEGVQILTALLGSQKVFALENNGAYTAVLADLDVEITRADNFNLPPTVANPADPVANPIATITRTAGYTLGINEEGTISCTDPGGATWTCVQAGY